MSSIVIKVQQQEDHRSAITTSPMELTWSNLLYSIIILTPTFLLLLFLHRRNSIAARLPPGPPGWPVFGHMFALGKMPHRTLAAMGKEYGPVIWLRLGSVNTIVVLTANAAAELFKNHDQSFADRKFPAVMTSHDYHKGSLALAPYGAYWRVLRRISAFEMLSVKKTNETEPIRRKCVDKMLTWIEREEARAVHVVRYAFLASFNMVANLVFSREVADPDSRDGSEFFSGLMGFMELTAKPNPADLFPWIRWIDPIGLRRKMDHRLGRLLSVVSGFVKERVEERRREGGAGGEKSKDFLDVLLDFEGNEKEEVAKLSEEQICIFLLEMFIGGTDTTSNTVEWAMAELLRNPGLMIKAKAELANVVGGKRKMEENDIENLPYLQALVKETMRLHPPLIFLIPRKAVRDTEFMGYHVPKNTQVFVNTWAIGRDAEYWDDPLCFKPERFLGSKVEYKGQHFELIPFGAGRRMCPGVALAHPMVHLMLGSLIHEFEWELKIEGGGGGERMDMRERLGMAVGKLEPLEAIPRKCAGRHSN